MHVEMEELTFVTGNKNKLAEVNHILGAAVKLKSQALDLPEIQGRTTDVAVEKVNCVGW